MSEEKKTEEERSADIQAAYTWLKTAEQLIAQAKTALENAHKVASKYSNF